MRCRAVMCALLVALAMPAAAASQNWNGEEALALVARGIARRSGREADSSLEDYRVRAHGFVFFLAQLAEGLQEPPRLIRSDELVLEVYWKAPNRSKQRIVGWRDRTDLPTDIQYHRDHLGVIQNNFGDRILMGEGDEVRDVPHPLAPAGPTLYEYALLDTVSMWLPERTVRVVQVLVRPRDYAEPRVVGSLFFDLETAEVVLFRFSFTRGAYLDDTVEDITVVLENGLWDERYWLPRRQEIEIRRRSKLLDMPARGIIRGRWEMQDYEFNVGLSDALFRGQEIVAVPHAVRDTFLWDEPMHAAIQRVAGPALAIDLEEARAQLKEIAGRQALSGLAAARLGVGSISDLLHFNRVEGLAPGLGSVFRPGGGPTEIKGWISYGLSDRRVKGRFEASNRQAAWTLRLGARHEIVDVADDPATSPLLNSILAQESGRDYGDYVLSDRLEVGVQRDFGVRGGASLSAAVDRTESVSVAAAPAAGAFRDNAAMGTGRWWIGRLALEMRSAVLALRGGVSGALAVEGGLSEESSYLRLRGSGRVQVVAGPTQIVAKGWAGWGSASLPPHRSFSFGGRGTLVGEEFRRWGGRYAALGVVEWNVPVPIPEISLGPFVTTGRHIVLAPFVGVGWAGGAVESVAWAPSQGVRPVVGVAVEWFHRFFRADFGISLRDGTAGLVVDVTRDLWSIL